MRTRFVTAGERKRSRLREKCLINKMEAVENFRLLEPMIRSFLIASRN